MEATACTGLTGLFTFFDACVAGKHTAGLEGGTKSFVHKEESAGDTVTESACLTCHTAAVKVGCDIDFAFVTGNSKNLHDEAGVRSDGEVFVDVTTVDDDFAGTGSHTDSGDGTFTTTGGTNFISIFSHDLFLHGNFDGFLSDLGIFCAGVNFEFTELSAAQTTMRKHTPNSTFDNAGGIAFTQFLGSGFFQTAAIAGIGLIDFAFIFFAGEDSFFSVDDDNISTGIDVGSIGRFVFAAESVGNFDSETADGGFGSVKEEMFSFDFSDFCQICFHNFTFKNKVSNSPQNNLRHHKNSDMESIIYR